jgi:hypothetical protein
MLRSYSKMRILNLQARMVLFQQQQQFNHRISNATTTMVQVQRYRTKTEPTVTRTIQKMMSTSTTETSASSVVLVSRRPPTPPMPRINNDILVSRRPPTPPMPRINYDFLVSRRPPTPNNNILVSRRPPTPPMPRINYDGVYEYKPPEPWWYLILGRIQLLTGVSILSFCFIDKYYSRPVPLNKDELINNIINHSKRKRQYLYNRFGNKPPLYQCKVIQQYRMSGSHGMYDIKLNDVVDVLMEQVGPQQLYHLCRFVHPPSDDDNVNTNDDTDRIIVKNENGDIIEIGWYPITHLEKIKIHWWKRLLFLA